MNNKVFYIWGFIIISLVSILTIIGYNIIKKEDQYNPLKDKLILASKQYMEDNFLYPKENESLKITIEELSNYLTYQDLIINNKVCNGYIIITYNNTYEYKPYLTCKASN